MKGSEHLYPPSLAPLAEVFVLYKHDYEDCELLGAARTLQAAQQLLEPNLPGSTGWLWTEERDWLGRQSWAAPGPWPYHIVRIELQ